MHLSGERAWANDAFSKLLKHSGDLTSVLTALLRCALPRRALTNRTLNLTFDADFAVELF